MNSRLQATASRIQLLHEVTAQHDDLHLLKCIVQTGWPGQIQEVPPEMQPNWNFCEEIANENGLLLKGTRIILPISPRQLYPSTSMPATSDCQNNYMDPSKSYTSLDYITKSRKLLPITRDALNSLKIIASRHIINN